MSAALTRANFPTDEAWLAYQQSLRGDQATVPQLADPNRARRSDFKSSAEWQGYRNAVKDGMTNPFDQAQMYAQQNKTNQFLKDAGAFGGIRESGRNNGVGEPKGIDWLKANYSRENNPYENGQINPITKAQDAVAEIKQQKAADAELQNMIKAQRGTVNTSDGKTQYFSNPANALPDFVTQVIPEQYGGGMGIGNAAPKFTEGVFNPDSKAPMATAEAYATDRGDNGIYAPENRESPTSMMANDARQQMTQSGIQNTVRDFYQQPRESEPVSEPTSGAAEIIGEEPYQEIRAQVSNELLQMLATGEDPGPMLDEAISMGVLTPDEAQLYEQAFLSRQPLEAEPLNSAVIDQVSPVLGQRRQDVIREQRDSNPLLSDWQKSTLNKADELVDSGLKSIPSMLMKIINGVAPRGNMFNPFD